MDRNNGFVIENNVVVKYQGHDNKVVVPDGVIGIGKRAFGGCSEMEAVILPRGIQEIESSAFEHCEHLTSVSFPDDFPYIGESMFWCCKKLDNIILPGSIARIGDNAFSDCTTLSSITLNEGLKSIGTLAFRSCNSLREITIPESVQIIEPRAFQYCKNLQTIIMPQKMESIGWGSFWECTSLTSIQLPAGLTTIASALFIRSGLKRIAIPDGVSTIEDSAFLQCRNLEEIVLPDTVMSIAGRRASDEEFGSFELCSALQRMELPPNVKIDLDSIQGCVSIKEFAVSKDSAYYSVVDGVLFSKNRRKLIAFPAGKECERYYIPEFVAEIGAKAFQDANCVKQVYITENVKKVSKKAFEKDTNAPLVFYSNPAFSDCLPKQVYVGGPLSDLPSKYQENAVNGFLIATNLGIKSIEQWEKSYISYIAKNASAYKKKAKKDEALAKIMNDNGLL